MFVVVVLVVGRLDDVQQRRFESLVGSCLRDDDGKPTVDVDVAVATDAAADGTLDRIAAVVHHPSLSHETIWNFVPPKKWKKQPASVFFFFLSVVANVVAVVAVAVVVVAVVVVAAWTSFSRLDCFTLF